MIRSLAKLLLLVVWRASGSGRARPLAWASGVVLVLALTIALGAAAQSPEGTLVFETGEVVPGIFAGDLSSPSEHGLKTPDRASSRISRIKRIKPTKPKASLDSFADLVLDIEGHGFTGSYPPSMVGDLGPSHYIQMVNSPSGALFVILDKSGAALVTSTPLDSMWSLGGDCASGLGTPVVLYDHYADRWLMSELASSGNHLCVYVSRTADPVSGGWYLYDFSTPEFPDYPKYAVWSDAYYVSSHESNPAAYALERVRMLRGLPARYQRFVAPKLEGFPLFQSFTPSDLDGPTPPPAGSPNYFLRHRDDEVHNPGVNDPNADFLELWELQVDFDDPNNSAFSGPLNIEVAEFDSDLCGLTSFACFNQPGTATPLDPLKEVLMWRVQYRNFGSHEALVGNWVTDVNGTDRGGIRWVELRRVGGGAWALHQEGTYSPNATNRWLGSIAADRVGNIALGYSSSSIFRFPAIRYTGRLASDPLGVLTQGESSIFESVYSQDFGKTSWGHSSSLNVDPVDDCTFWYTNEYVSNDERRWGTRIASFAFPDCEVVGGLHRGLVASVSTVACDNLTSGESESAIVTGTTAWDCEGMGLAVNSGDLIRVSLLGIVAGGVADVGGSLSGIDSAFVYSLCANQNTGQVVAGLELGSTSWNCEADGLVVNAGDRVGSMLFGVAK